MAGAIAQDRESCQFPFVLDEKPLLYRSGRPESDRESRERGFLWRRSLELRASGARSAGCVSTSRGDRQAENAAGGVAKVTVDLSDPSPRYSLVLIA
jgi:hypothetical protein